MVLGDDDDSEAPHISIHVTNLAPNERLSFPLALLRGNISSTDNHDPLSGNLVLMCHGVTAEWPVVQGRFKALTELRPGMNHLELSYQGHAKLNLKLTYTPRTTQFRITPVYIVNDDHDGSFQGPPDCDRSSESARSRITLASRLLQTVVAEKLWELGLGRKSFALSEGGCEEHRSKLTLEEARSMDQEQLWKHYGRELLSSWGETADNHKFLAFLACTSYEGAAQSRGLTHAQVLERTKGHAALGGGGLAIFGTGCLHSWPQTLAKVLPCLNDTTPVDQRHLMDDSCYRGTYGGCLATTLGSVLHELCHTFDLGHTSQGIMGRGFDRMDLVLVPEGEDPNDTHHIVPFTVNLSVSCRPGEEAEERGGRVTGGRDKETSRGGSKGPSKPCLPPASCKDQTFFTQSCGTLLAYHRWFNDDSTSDLGDLEFNDKNWVLQSSAGLRVVEVRQGEAQEVRASWCFPQGRKLFVLPRSATSHNGATCLTLVAEDSRGALLKMTLNP